MARHGVPTARYRVCRPPTKRLRWSGSGELGEPVVVKADGLAAGKGVVVAPDADDSRGGGPGRDGRPRVRRCGSAVVLEERLVGPEVSFFVVADGEASCRWSPRRITSGSSTTTGPNTGGMGAFAPSPLVDDALRGRITDEIVRPCSTGMARGHAVPRVPLLRADADRGRSEGHRVQRPLRRPEGAGGAADDREPLAPLLLGPAAEGRIWTRRHGRGPRGGTAAPTAVRRGRGAGRTGYPGVVETGQRIEGLEHLAHEYPDVLAFFAGVGGVGGRPGHVLAGAS